jgi:predicted deacylase
MRMCRTWPGVDHAGIPAITAEAGGCGLAQEYAVALHVAGLNAVLSVLGMTDDQVGREPPSRPPPRAVPMAALPPGGMVAADRGLTSSPAVADGGLLIGLGAT